MFTENLAPFFNVADFAITATLDGVPVDGIFDAAYTQPLLTLAEGSAPVFTLPTSLTTTTVHGSDMVINGEPYKVRGIEPDGTGVTILKLEKQ